MSPKSLYFFNVNFCNWCLFKVGQGNIGFPRIYFILPFLNFVRFFRLLDAHETLSCALKALPSLIFYQSLGSNSVAILSNKNRIP